MFEHGSSASHRPDGASGAGATPDGAGAANGRTTPANGFDERRVNVSLATGWPRLCHDLRTPLNAILGNAELLLDGSAGPLSREARGCLGDIQTAAGRMMRHVQALLELCRARSRPALAADACVDLVALLAAAAPAGRSAPAVRIVPDGARFVVRGDAAWLQLLADMLAELHLGDGGARGPLHLGITPGSEGGYSLLRLWWDDLDPDQVAALPLALTDAILDLHEGQLSLTPDGLLLHWPVCRMGQLAIPTGSRIDGRV
jgi:hypothetical protein